MSEPGPRSASAPPSSRRPLGRLGPARRAAAVRLHHRDPARRRAGADDPAGPAPGRGPRRAARPHRRADPRRRRRHRPAVLRRRAAPGHERHGARARPLRARAGPPRGRARHAGAGHLPRHAADQRRASAAPCSQHLPEVVGHEEHRRNPGSFDGSDHDVRLEPGSLAARAAGEELHGTKSHHHQGVDALGEGLVDHRPSRRSTTCPRRSRSPTARSCSACSGIPRPTSAAG